MNKLFFCIVYILCVVSSIKSQRNIVTNPLEIDYLSYKYKYLDKNYNIHINSTDFNKAVEKYQFYPNKIRNYNDSLGVIMMIEFDDWQKCNVATNVVGYSWVRLSYHLWLTVDESKKLAKSFKINHPWRMKQFLIDENNKNKNVVKFFEDLKLKIYNKNQAIKFEGLNRSKILNLALSLNSQRIANAQKDAEIRRKEAEAYEKKHGKVDPSKLGVGCEKEDCCQKAAIQKKVTEKEKEIY